METEAYGHVSIARAVEFDFFEDGQVSKSVRFNRFGEAHLINETIETPLVTTPEGQNFINGMEVILRVPNPPYEGELEGRLLQVKFSAVF